MEILQTKGIGFFLWKLHLKIKHEETHTPT